MANFALPSFLRRAPGLISRMCIPNKLGVRGEIPVRCREVGHGHWRARDDTSPLLPGPLRAGLSPFRILQIPAGTDVFRGLEQDFPQFNSQDASDAHQRVESRFAFAPVEQADGGLVEAADLA